MSLEEMERKVKRCLFMFIAQERCKYFDARWRWVLSRRVIVILYIYIFIIIDTINLFIALRIMMNK